ncbi:helix-turn-helix domain-containing protein [Pradoshia sp.]
MTELGKILKEARETKGLSLDDLQQITKIQKRYLIGIEEGNYDMMPGQFYVRAFIKQYAEAVGLDAEQLFAEHQTEIPVPVQQEEVPQNLSRVQSRKSIAVQDSKWVDLLPKILIAIVLVAIAAVIYYFVAKAISNNDNAGTTSDNNQQVQVEEGNLDSADDNKADDKAEDEKAPQEDAADSEDEAKEDEPAAGELKLASSSGNSSTYDLSNADEFKVAVKSTGESWVTVKDSTGKTVFNNMITADNPQEFDQTDDTQISLNIGRSTDIEVFVNDEKIDYESDSIVQNIIINYTKE